MIKAENRLGLEKKNKFGTLMRIIKVLPNDKIIVQFQDEFACIKEICWTNFKTGNVKNPYDRTNCGTGYIGEGKYKSVQANGRHTREYSTWNDMIVRCYKEKTRHLHPAYENCTVCKEWHNFQTFCDWYFKNYYDYTGGRLHIDKDILNKGNTVYAPDRCLLVPQKINMIFMTKAKKTDQDLPNAIYRCKNGFRSSYNGKSLGTFKTLDEAITAHDTEMIKHIKQLAEEYKTILPKKVYKALINYK